MTFRPLDTHVPLSAFNYVHLALMYILCRELKLRQADGLQNLLLRDKLTVKKSCNGFHGNRHRTELNTARKTKLMMYGTEIVGKT